MERTMTTETIAFSKKSGKGTMDGVVSELTAIFGIQPGHEEQIRAACERFGEVFRNADPKVHQKTGLRDMKHVIFDNGSRLLLITTFETDWDPYINDAVTLIGVEHWIDWMQHTVEAVQLRGALLHTRGLDTSSTASSADLEQAVQMGSSDLKQVLQSAQVRAVYYFNDLAALTVPHIKKAVRLEEAFQQVLDDPRAEQALQQPVLKPLLAEAAQ
jgi:hypothetical protein